MFYLGVKIVTDSAADLPPELAEELGVTVVSVYLRFGDEVYHDRVDISEDEFYRRLLHDSIYPSTTQPTPKDFTDAYQKLSQEADGIVSIHITSRLSGTYSSAIQGKKSVEDACPIEVIDSETVSIGTGLIAMEAAKIAASGKSLQQVVAGVRQIIPTIRLLILFDTLKYLAKGGRIGKAKALLGSVLNVKPLLTIEDGELLPVAQVRTRAKGIQRLFDFVMNAIDIQDLSILYSTTPDEAQTLAERVGSIFPRERITLARLGPALGVHGGPGVLAIAFREK
ncbi:DegV family protein [Chloroflexota bacterium]